MTHRRRRARSGDRGVVTVLFALILTALVIVVALVIDYGIVRNSRQDSKSTTDAVTAAAIQSLAADGVPRSWRGACAALSYLRANEPSRSFDIQYFRGDGVTAVTGDPCSTLTTAPCVPNMPSSWAWIQAVDGDYVVDIRTGYATPDPMFPEDASSYGGDDGVSARGSCDQLAVIISRRDPEAFGSIVGATNYDTAIRTVGRVAIRTENEGVPAFVMLERKTCGALSQSVGASEGGIIVRRSLDGRSPGIIAVDSAASEGCTGGPNAEGNFAVFSSELGTGQSKRPGILVEDASLPNADGVIETGKIFIYAIAAGNTGNASATAAGISPAPVEGLYVSRKRVDERYNPDAPDTPTITNLHETAQPLANRTTPPAGYEEVTTCNNHNNAGDPSATAALIFVNCPAGYSPDLVTFGAARDIIFNGPVTISNNKALFLPVAERVIIGGTTAGGLVVNGGGRLLTNGTAFANNDTEVAAACNAPDGPGSRATQLVIFGGGSSGNTEGALNLSGRTALCKTAAYLAGPKSLTTYARQETTAGYHSTCSPEKPCPKDTGNVATNAHAVIGAYVRWTAPNQTFAQLTSNFGVEDLALWTESAQTTRVGTNAVLDMKGVFFLPNARMEMRSPASFTPRDAQFIARSLKLFQGTLEMSPTPNNSVSFDVFASASLVR